MTWDEVYHILPNGFHDARLDAIGIDYRRRKAVFDLELLVVKKWPEQAGTAVPELYRRGKLTFGGLLACAVDVPNGEYQEPDACALWIDLAPTENKLPEHSSWPQEALPPGAFVRSFYFLNDAASFVHVAARDVYFEWLGEARLLKETFPECREAVVPGVRAD